MRPVKWYRSEKREMRPFLHRIWYGSTPMRGNRHQCQCARRHSLDKPAPDRWKAWRGLFEPVRRIRRKVRYAGRNGRPVPFWTKKP